MAPSRRTPARLAAQNSCNRLRRSVLPELSTGVKLLTVVERWLRDELTRRRARMAANPTSMETPVQPSRTPMMPSKHLAFFR